MNNTNENPTANQFENWSIIHFDTLLDMYVTFQEDCPNTEQSLEGFIEYMYEHGQDVVATWNSPNVDYQNN